MLAQEVLIRLLWSVRVCLCVFVSVWLYVCSSGVVELIGGIHKFTLQTYLKVYNLIALNTLTLFWSNSLRYCSNIVSSSLRNCARSEVLFTSSSLVPGNYQCSFCEFAYNTLDEWNRLTHRVLSLVLCIIFWTSSEGGLFCPCHAACCYGKYLKQIL